MNSLKFDYKTIIITIIFISIILITLIIPKTSVNKNIECEQLENSNEVIYTKKRCIIKDDYKKNYTLEMPYINLKGNSVKKLNYDLNTIFNKNLTETTYTSKKNKEKFENVFLYSYKALNSLNYLSLIVKFNKLYKNSSAVQEISIYNIDLKNQKIIEDKDLLALFPNSLTNNDFIYTLIKIYQKEFSYDYYNQELMYMDTIVYNYIYYFDYRNSRDIIVNNKGNLVYILQIPSLNSGNGITCYLEVDNNKISYSFEL